MEEDGTGRTGDTSEGDKGYILPETVISTEMEG
jgi:hypothetical protein